MAPTNRFKLQEASPILNKVQSGRIGQSTPNRKYVKKNQGKELLPATNNKDKELFPGTKNANKELFPELLPAPLSRASMPLSIPSKAPPASIRHSRTARNHSQSATSSRPLVKRSWRPNKGRASLAVQAVNLEQRRAKQVRDSMIKRLQALHSDPNHLVVDARDAKTTPYTAARLDLKPNTSIIKDKKLNFFIAVGFWGYTPTFTPVKIFSLSQERFSDVQGLVRLVFDNTDVQKAAAGIAIDSITTTFVGFEMSFPKGYRFVQGEAIDPVRGCAVPFQTVPSDRCALVNTDCALKEFFWQTEHYASDEEGNVLIQVTVRIGITHTQPSGETVFEKLNINWRTDEEKQWEAEEKRQNLEKQSFASGAEKRELKEKMKAIEERAQRAMENAKARKEELEKGNVSQSQLTLASGVSLQPPMRSCETEMKDSRVDENGSEIELDLDIEFD